MINQSHFFIHLNKCFNYFFFSGLAPCFKTIIEIWTKLFISFIWLCIIKICCDICKRDSTEFLNLAHIHENFPMIAQNLNNMGVILLCATVNAKEQKYFSAMGRYYSALCFSKDPVLYFYALSAVSTLKIPISRVKEVEKWTYYFTSCTEKSPWNSKNQMCSIRTAFPFSTKQTL